MNKSENERSRPGSRKGQPKGRPAGDEATEELSPAWRELLGIESSGKAGNVVGQAQQPEGSSSIPTVAGDPWVDLVHEKGVEEVDLQRTRLREQQKGQASAEDSDVKHALDLMQEKPDAGEKP